MVQDWRAKAAADGIAVSRERLRSAQILAEAGQYRDAISRSYYAVLAAANACLAARGVRTRSHAGTIAQFSLLFIQTGIIPREYGRSFARIEGQRMDADYEMSKAFSAQQAAMILGMAQEFVQRAENLLPDLLSEGKT